MPADYFERRERELAAQGRDSDDDTAWVKPDYEERERELGEEWPT